MNPHFRDVLSKPADRRHQGRAERQEEKVRNDRIPFPRAIARRAHVVCHLACRYAQYLGSLDRAGRVGKSLQAPCVAINFSGKLTRECATACTDSSMQLCIPSLRIIVAMWALTVRSTMPSGKPISLLESPVTNIFKTCFSRSVMASLPLARIRFG